MNKTLITEPAYRQSALGEGQAMETELLSEESLFERYLDRKEQEALDALVKKWHASAYRVARCICRNDALAEEAVQDAFVRIVSQRARFENRGPGSFRCWFLTLVTNSARMVRRSESRTKRRESVECQSEDQRPLRVQNPSDSNLDREEIRQALECALESMNERFRVPLALHFLEGMQQKDLAFLLGVSQQMVSRRIEQGLERLRMRLAQTGLSLSVAVLEVELEQAGLFASPDGLANRLLDSLHAPSGAALSAHSLPERLAAESVRQSARKGLLWWPWAALSLIAIGVAAFVMKPGAQPEEHFETAQTPLAMPEPSLALTKSEPIQKENSAEPAWSWTFDRELPPEFVKIQGELEWTAEGLVNGSGALRAGKSNTQVFLPANIPSECVISFDLRFLPGHQYRAFKLSPQWEDQQNDPLFGLYKPIEDLNGDDTKFFETYLTKGDGHLRMTINGKPCLYVVYGPPPGQSNKDGIILGFSNADLDNVRVRAATPADRDYWKRWQAEHQAYALLKNFDTLERTFNLYGFGLKFQGPFSYQAQGPDGSPAVRANASPSEPVHMGIPSASGSGIQLVEFDWQPLNEEAAKPEALNLYAGPASGKESALEVASRLVSRPAPNQFKRALLETGSPALKRWHEVAFLAGSQGTLALVDGKLFGEWTDPRKIQDSCCLILRIEGQCLIDNFRSRCAQEPQEKLLERLRSGHGKRE